MLTTQLGDQVQVHYVKRFQDGSVFSSRDSVPLEMTVGTDHPRLPGLGLALVGMAPGTRTKISVPAELAYGVADPSRVHRVARHRFPKNQLLPVGKWVPIQNRKGRSRLVRVLEVHGKMVVVDANHRWAGQAMELEVEVIGIKNQSAGSEMRNLDR